MSSKHLNPYAFNPIVPDASSLERLSISSAKKKLERFVKQDAALHSTPNDIVQQLGLVFDALEQRYLADKMRKGSDLKSKAKKAKKRSAEAMHADEF